jgi:SPASM domain peptide maturase of grasp-with-spasm system
MSEIFKMYANCKLVQGQGRDVIYDLQRGGIFPVPKEWGSQLVKANGLDRSDLEGVDSLEGADLQEAVQYVLDLELGFWANSSFADNFSALGTEWDHPAEIINSIVDLPANDSFDIESIVRQVLELGCRHFVFRLNPGDDIAHLNLPMAVLKDSLAVSVEIAVNLQVNSGPRIQQFLLNNPKVIRLMLYNANESDVDQLSTIVGGDTSVILEFHEENITQYWDKARVDPSYFTVNVQAFSEAQSHHLFFNRKLHINSCGEIKNAPSTSKIFGYANCTKIADVVRKADFQEFWNIDKSQIAGCEDCEYRAICIDSRDLVKDKSQYVASQYCPYDKEEFTWNFEQ